MVARCPLWSKADVGHSDEISPSPFMSAHSRALIELMASRHFRARG